MKLIFANEWWLLALPLIGFGGWGLWVASRRIAEKRLRAFFSERFAKEAAKSIDRKAKLWRFLASLAVLIFLAAALSRPLTGPKIQTAERQGFDFVVALDVSKSMLTEDVAPNRLAAVKKDFAEFLKHEAGDRIGLVLFAGEAFVQAPLTFDYDALGLVLDQAGPKSISLGSTDVAKAIERAQAMLEKNPAESRTLVIVSDGEDIKAEAVEAARKAHAKDHLTIYTVGVGTTEGGRVPAQDYSKESPPDGRQKRYMRDEYGMEAYSRKDERTLRAIAEAGGGRYYDFKPGAQTFQLWHDQNLLTLAKKDQKLDISDYFEWFQLPLLCAILLLVAEPLLHSRRKRSAARVGVAVVQPETFSRPVAREGKPRPVTAKAAALALFLLSATQLKADPAPAPPPTDPTQQADQLLTQGKNDEAISLMQKAAQQNSTDLGLYYNYGMTLYRAGHYQEAADVFQTIETTSPDKDMQARAVMQMGNAQFHLGEDQKSKGSLSGAALAMERALGYYETLDSTDSSHASRTNRQTATDQLKQILLDLAKERAKAADTATQQNDLQSAEQGLRDAMQAYDRVQQLDPNNAEAKKSEEEIRQKLVANLTKQAEQKALEADAMDQHKAPSAQAGAQPPPPTAPNAATAQTSAQPQAPQPGQNPSQPSSQPNAPQTAANTPSSAPAAAAPNTPPSGSAQAQASAPQTPNSSTPLPAAQGKRNDPMANPQQDVIAKRQEAVAEYDQALEQSPDNKALQAARQDQLNKISDLLTAHAEKVAAPLLANQAATPRERNTLEQVGKTLGEALADNPNNQKAQDLSKQVSQTLENAYNAEGEAALAAAEMTPRNAAKQRMEAQRQLNQVSKAATDFQKALDQNSNSERAKAGLAKAQSKLPELYAALGKDDMDKAKEAAGADQPQDQQKGGPSQEALQKAVGFLEKATQDYDQAVAMAPDNADYKAGQAEAQQMLASYRDQLDKQMQANAQHKGQKGDEQATAQAGNNSQQDQPGDQPGDPLSMTDLRGAHAAPLTSDKFWDKKIKDW